MDRFLFNKVTSLTPTVKTAKIKSWRRREKNKSLHPIANCTVSFWETEYSGISKTVYETEPRLIPYCKVSAKQPLPPSPTQEASLLSPSLKTRAGGQTAISGNNLDSWTITSVAVPSGQGLMTNFPN